MANQWVAFRLPGWHGHSLVIVVKKRPFGNHFLGGGLASHAPYGNTLGLHKAMLGSMVIGDLSPATTAQAKRFTWTLESGLSRASGG
jgi:hypothetical protein